MLLSGVLVFLLAALFKPTIPIKHNIYTYLLIADISQSMNANDMTVDGKPATRIAHTQKIMRETISSLPCGTKVSIGLFAGNSVAALYNPDVYKRQSPLWCQQMRRLWNHWYLIRAFMM